MKVNAIPYYKILCKYSNPCYKQGDKNKILLISNKQQCKLNKRRPYYEGPKVAKCLVGKFRRARMIYDFPTVSNLDPMKLKFLSRCRIQSARRKDPMHFYYNLLSYSTLGKEELSSLLYKLNFGVRKIYGTM